MPLDILKKCPRLYAAYEEGSPELSAIPEEVAHVLVHYLHTGTYQTLRPRSTDRPSRQIWELRTSIQTYATARAYELDGLMRLAESKINRFGNGLSLPALLEVARDAYPTLTEGDEWFIDYLRSRIRPHLKDPKSLLGSDLLDQISGILSPHKVLLRTVLELFCERIAVRPESAGSPLTSPGGSRPVTPHPPNSTSPASVLDLRSRSIVREDVTPTRRKTKSLSPPDVVSETASSNEASPEPEPAHAETTHPQPEDNECRSISDLRPAILDAVLQGELPDGAKDKSAAEPDVETAVEPDTKEEEEEDAEPEAKVGGAVLVPEAATEPQVVKQEEEEETVRDDDGPSPPERKDSGKALEFEGAIPNESESAAPEHVAELESESASAKPQVQVPRSAYREVDSGFWETTPVEPAPAHELEAEAKPKDDAPGIDARDFAAGAEPEAAAEAGKDKQVESQPDAPEEAVPVSLPEQAPVSDKAAEKVTEEASEKEAEKTAEEAPEQPVAEKPAEEETTEKPAEKAAEAAPKTGLASVAAPVKPAEEAAGQLAEATKSAPAPETALAEPEQTQDKEVNAHPDTEKVEPFRSGIEQESPLTIQQAQEENVEPEAVAKPHPEPEAASSKPVDPSDDAQPAGPAESKAAQPSVEPEPKPAGEPEIQAAATDAAVQPARGDAGPAKAPVLGAEPAPEPEGSKNQPELAGGRPCSAQVRQRSWKRRFLSLRYPVLFGGRGM